MSSAGSMPDPEFQLGEDSLVGVSINVTNGDAPPSVLLPGHALVEKTNSTGSNCSASQQQQLQLQQHLAMQQQFLVDQINNTCDYMDMIVYTVLETLQEKVRASFCV